MPTVILIDPSITSVSPAMKSIVGSIPELKANGWRVEALTHFADPSLALDEVHLIPSLRIPKVLGFFFFTFAVNVYAALNLRKRMSDPDVILLNGNPHCFYADVCTVHFASVRWIRIQLRLGITSFRELAELALSGFSAAIDLAVWRASRCRRFLPPSDSMGAIVGRYTHSAARVQTLPNSFPRERLNSENRKAWRVSAREALEFSPDELVFAFSSQGHYRRKGFWRAVSGLAEYRKRSRSNAKLLVIGGYPATLERLQQRLSSEWPGWREWIKFTGFIVDSEKTLAAADAFLFPSYFEAFSLVEIEAAAMGIPLLLTEHCGSEMILERGVNGLLLGESPKEIADGIETFAALGPDAFSYDIKRALSQEEYAAKLRSILEEIRLEKALPLSQASASK